MWTFFIKRAVIGVLTVFCLSIVIFAATQILPGDAAQAILGRSATPERLQALREQLHLDVGAVTQYRMWLSNLLKGDLGVSLGNGRPVAEQLVPHAVNSLILVCLVAAIALPLTTLLGILAAMRPNRPFDAAFSIISLIVAALPEFVVAIGLIIVFATTVSHLLPPVSLVLPGFSPLDNPRILVLPVATLSIVVFPYLFRMVRGSMIEIMRSEYIEMARLKGLSRWRTIFVHALPNAAAPAVQVIALTIAYLAGGVAVVEYVFGYPGLGGLLIASVTTRDVPVIQSVILLLAAVYVTINVLSDVLVILLTPRRRTGA